MIHIQNTSLNKIWTFWNNFTDHVWKRLAQIHFEETQENYLDKLENFYEHLLAFQNKDECKRSAKLLYNIPTLDITKLHAIYDNDLGNEDTSKPNGKDVDRCSQHISRFLLKFLRGGNYNIESATTLLLAYLEMMKDRPKYYDGFTNSGRLTL